MATLVGSTIGDYRLTGFLGAGGMGEVYLAEQRTLGRTVAIKVLSAGQPPELNQRFLNEARLHAQLKHPQIVTLYDFLDFDGRPCIVMEMVPGESIEERIRRVGALPVSEAVFILQQLAGALAHVHGQGIIHRDIKSGNVKITPSDQVKLLDFGIARGRNLPRMTQAGQFVGTLQYSSPEQLRGEEVDAQSDVWAMGVLFYEMVTGQMPFEAISVGDLVEKIQRSSYPPPSVLQPRVPAPVEALIKRCLAARKENRYVDAGTLQEDAVALSKLVSTPRLSSSLASHSPAARFGRGAAGGSFADLRSKLASLSPTSLGAPIASAWRQAADLDPRWLLGVGGLAALLFFGWAVSGRSPGPSPAPPPVAAVNTARVVIDSPTGTADIWIDGAKVGETPWTSEMPVGHEIKMTLRRPGYRDRVEAFQVRELDNAYTYPLHKAP